MTCYAADWLHLSRLRERSARASAPGEGFFLLGVLDCGDTLSPTLPRKRGRERTFSAVAISTNLIKLRPDLFSPEIR
jgi:hypothetical protein